MPDSERTKAQLIHELNALRCEVAELRDAEASRRELEEALRRTEERYRDVVNSLTSYLYSVEVREGRAISTWHGNGCIPVTGYRPEDFQADARLWFSMIHPDDRETVEKSINRLLKGSVVPPLEHRLVRQDGAVVWVRNTMVSHYDDKGRLTKYDGVIEDITDRKDAETEHRESEDRFRTVAQTAVDAIILADSGGKVIFWNDSAKRIFGYTEEEMAGRPLTILMSPEDADAHQEGLERIKATGKSKYIGKMREMRAVRRNGEGFPIELSVSMWTVGQKTFYSGIIRDITKRKRLESELKTLATTDTLTQVFNRIKYDEIVKREIEGAKRYNHPLSLIMFDIDHFKKVNDTFGHAAGDYVLQTLTRIVKRDLRETDYLVRWGGEEFVIIAPDTDLERAKVLADRVRHSTEGYGFQRVGAITVSLGVTQFVDSDTEDTFIKRADDALYSAKRMGRNRVEVVI